MVGLLELREGGTYGGNFDAQRCLPRVMQELLELLSSSDVWVNPYVVVVVTEGVRPFFGVDGDIFLTSLRRVSCWWEGQPPVSPYLRVPLFVAEGT